MSISDNEYNRLKNEYIKMLNKGEFSGDNYNKCSICGSTKYLDHHHIIPLSQGGENNTNNVISLCHSCHMKAHGRNAIKGKKYKKRGRKKMKKPEIYKEVMAAYVGSTDFTYNECCELLGVGKNTFYRWLYEDYPKFKGKANIPYRRYGYD